MQSSQATHLLGAEITYECIDSCNYRIYHRTYYDCGGAFMLGGSYVPINFVSPNPPPDPGLGFQITGIPDLPGQQCSSPVATNNWTLQSYQEVTQLCPGGVSNCTDLNSSVFGVVGAIWTRDYNFCLANCNTYELEWDNCCRNNAITSGAASDAMYIGGITIRPNDTTCNESPTFTEDPAVHICLGTSTAVPQGGVDPEGDSLVYSLTSCFDNPGIPAGYNLGYSPQTPLGPHWSVNLDPITGWLTFVPDSLASLEVGILCVRVDEYRNGVQVGSLVRDLQIIVTTCDTGQAPVTSPIQLVNGGQALSANSVGACPGTPITFKVAALDPNVNDSLTLSSSISQVLSGAQIVISGSNPAVMEVTWTPDSSDINQIYPFVLSAYDETCPYPLHTLETYYVDVSGPCLGAITMDTQCNDSTGSIDLTVHGGVPPYTFLWNTGATTEDLNNLPPGTYWVDVTDSAGTLSLSDTFYINANELALVPSITPPDCDGNGGQIDVQVFGGSAPYTFDWSNGSQSNPLTGILPGGYSVTVTDVNGCPQHEVYFLESPDSCFVSVSGTAYYDLNGNCVQDTNELGIAYMFIEITPGSATFTDANGNYTVHVDTGAYVFEAQPAPSMYLSPLCPTNGQHSLTLGTYSSDTTGVDFAMDVIPVQDLRISGSFVGWNNPGFPYVYSLHAYNDGNLPVNATVEFELDSLMSYDSTNVTPVVYDPVAHSLTWQINPMVPGQMEWIKIYGVIDSTASIGDSLTTIATIHPIPGDTTPGNNVFVDVSSTVGSYDPNDKQVSPTGFGEEGFIEAHENEMVYTIRFQNTGNFPAQFVVIRDTIHPNLNIGSYRQMNHSHVYTLDVEEDSILVFTFANINLPDSASDPAGSQGHISFQLNHQGSLELGDQITNSSAIYFDFNDPIITNEVVNTIYSPMALDFLADVKLCPGDSIMAVLAQTGLAPYSYEWNTGAQGNNNTEINYPTAVSTPGFYTLTITDALGISVSDSIDVDVTQLPVGSFGTDIQGLQVEFTDSSLHADTWIWDFGDGNYSTDPSPKHTYAASGTFNGKLIVSNSCGVDTVLFSIPLTTGIEDVFGRSVKVVPNPFSQQTRIQFSNPAQRVFEIVVMDVRGKEVRRFEGVRTTEIVLNREELGAGLYLFQITGKLNRYTGKLMIE
ncbi:MAG: PKD domain-containing protein [Bacteroidota bacterium]